MSIICSADRRRKPADEKMFARVFEIGLQYLLSVFEERSLYDKLLSPGHWRGYRGEDDGWEHKDSHSLVPEILRGQCPLLDSDHAMLNADMVELEQLQSMYDAQLEDIQSRRRAVQRALENRKSAWYLLAASRWEGRRRIHSCDMT
ncbi:hypothetical protein ARMGADRAFT_1032819 [Armillaria gallica]|uniref:Uncharacterized protein n=1 Tax=Armillaria gallica TaxID=47427 RepID=A0A2H3D930_ARMGA|nr:hypothetical protein ARMGADRAFT_1032819 [Armillaria gallica]